MGQTESKPASALSSDEIKIASWIQKAQEKQQIYLDSRPIHFRERLQSICVLFNNQCKTCGRVDDFSYSNDAEMNFLKKLTGTLIFGKPQEQALKGNSFTGFGKDQMKKIDTVFTELVKGISGSGVEISILWIPLMNGGKNKEPTEAPVFRVHLPGNETENKFVDLLGRRYKDWNDFLSNNKLPSSLGCFPKDGKYSANVKGEVETDFQYTPEAKLPKRIFRVTDGLAGVVAVGAGGLCFFPPAFLPCAVIGGLVSVYGAVRASVRLADRGNHNQSIADRAAFREWVSLVGCVLGLGSSGAMVACRLLAAEGKLISGALAGLKCFTGVVNGVGAVDRTLDILRYKKLPDPLDSFLLAAHFMLLFACSGQESMRITIIEMAKTYVLPLIVSKMKGILQNIHCYVDLKTLFCAMETVSRKFRYGHVFMRAVRIIVDCYNCKSLKEAVNILGPFINLLHNLSVARKFQAVQEEQENYKGFAIYSWKEAEEEKVMSDIVNDDNFIPQLLYFLNSQEKNFHFPIDHRYWGANGELLPEEYSLIGQNFLNVPKGVQSEVWKDGAGTANVHFKDYGLVTIKSNVDQQIMTIKNIKKFSVCSE